MQSVRYCLAATIGATFLTSLPGFVNRGLITRDVLYLTVAIIAPFAAVLALTFRRETEYVALALATGCSIALLVLGIPFSLLALAALLFGLAGDQTQLWQVFGMLTTLILQVFSLRSAYRAMTSTPEARRHPSAAALGVLLPIAYVVLAWSGLEAIDQSRERVSSDTLTRPATSSRPWSADRKLHG